MVNENVFEQLNDLIENGIFSQKKIAGYIKNYSGNYNYLKISDISQNCYVSNATVVRFAQKLGYLGFPELKLQLEYQRGSYDGNDNVFLDHTSIDAHYNNILESFSKTKNLINANDISQIVSILENREKINLFALGETNIVAKDFQLKLVRIGKIVTAFSDIHSQHFCACNSDENTLAIGITYSASTKEILENLSESKKNGATTLLITSVKTRIPKYVDYYLNVEASESIARVFSTTSRFTMMFLMDIIYHKFIENNSEYYNEKLIQTRLKK